MRRHETKLFYANNYTSIDPKQHKFQKNHMSALCHAHRFLWFPCIGLCSVMSIDLRLSFFGAALPPRCFQSNIWLLLKLLPCMFWGRLCKHLEFKLRFLHRFLTPAAQRGGWTETLLNGPHQRPLKLQCSMNVVTAIKSCGRLLCTMFPLQPALFLWQFQLLTPVKKCGFESMYSI